MASPNRWVGAEALYDALVAAGYPCPDKARTAGISIHAKAGEIARVVFTCHADERVMAAVSSLKEDSND